MESAIHYPEQRTSCPSSWGSILSCLYLQRLARLLRASSPKVTSTPGQVAPRTEGYKALAPSPHWGTALLSHPFSECPSGLQRYFTAEVTTSQLYTCLCLILLSSFHKFFFFFLPRFSQEHSLKYSLHTNLPSVPL